MCGRSAFLKTDRKIGNMVNTILYGEVPAALIKLKKGTVIEEAEIKAFLKSQMASYKVPQKILFTENIPLTENMKINKRKVRKMFSEQLEGELNI